MVGLSVYGYKFHGTLITEAPPCIPYPEKSYDRRNPAACFVDFSELVNESDELNSFFGFYQIGVMRKSR